MNTTESKVPIEATGGCLCGAVRYEVLGKLRGVYNCHCGQCRRSHGHLGAYSSVKPDQITLTETRGLKWYVSSAIARRGFCGECGSSLFYRMIEEDRYMMAVGSFDDQSGFELARQVFIDEKPGFYAFAQETKTSTGDDFFARYAPTTEK